MIATLPEQKTQQGSKGALAGVGGFTTVATTRNFRDSRLPKATDTCEVVAALKKRVKAKCGRMAPQRFVLSIFGERTRVISSKKSGCPECVTKELTASVIRCALCGLPIWPGQAVGLYSISLNKRLLRLNIATKVGDNAIGCMRWNCGEGAAFAGHWTGEEIQLAFGGKTFLEHTWEKGEVTVANI
jgi:hypothetical protein